jgi:hypothetical protein
MKFMGHRDTASIRVIDAKDGATVVLFHVYVLGVHTLPEHAVRLKLVCDKSRNV